VSAGERVRITCSFGERRAVFERDAAQLIIGRPSAGFPVDVDLTPDQQVSRPHARVWLEGGQYWIEDLDSARGTRVGGEEIKGRGRRGLRTGDVIQIGRTTLRVEALPVDAAIPAPRAAEPGARDPAVAIAETVDAGASVFPAAGGRRGERRLAALYELPLRLGREMELDRLLQETVDELIAAVPDASRCALLVHDPATGGLLLKAHVPVGGPAVSLTLARRAMEERQAFIWRRGPDLVASATEHELQSGMYAPLVWQGEAIGVVCVASTTDPRAFDAEDLRFVVAVAQHAAMAVVNRRLREELRRNAILLERLLTSFSPKIRARLLERARHGKLPLGGEKSEVTILVADIRGFTRLAAGMDAEDVVEMLNAYFGPLVEAIFGHDGTVDKFGGDSVLAVFGSPEPDVAQHEKAVRAGLALQAAVERVSAGRAGRGEICCQLGVGIHCGEVLHGFVGSTDRMEFTVIGDAVNRAARYCDGAGPGEVLISPAVHQRVWRGVQAEATRVPTKHEGELPAFRVTGLRAAVVPVDRDS